MFALLSFDFQLPQLFIKIKQIKKKLKRFDIVRKHIKVKVKLDA